MRTRDMTTQHTIGRLSLLLGAGVLLGAPAAAAQSGPATAQPTSQVAVDQVSPVSPFAVQQLDATQQAVNAGVASRPVQQLDRNAVRQTAPAQVTSPGAGRNPSLGQSAPRGTEAPTAQLADRNTNPRLGALPRQLVDACDQAAAGKRKPPAGVDCKNLVQALPPRRVVSAEEALLSDSLERDGQRLANDRFARGQAPDAAEVARRLSIGDLRNSPVAQAVAAQAAAEAGAQQSVPSGSRPVVVPGGGGVVVQPGGN
jgi:hypothetical protein